MKKVAVFDSHGFEQQVLEKQLSQSSLNKYFGFEFLPLRLTAQTARSATGAEAVCSFANDKIDYACLETLNAVGVRFIALRCAGFNHVDLKAASHFGIRVARVPAYSPHAIAEHAVALILALNRHIAKATSRVKDLNFSLDGLVGFDLFEKTVGVIGVGKIGEVFCRIMRGFGCKVIAYDPAGISASLAELGVSAVSLDSVFQNSDIISLHCPLNEKTKHLVDAQAIEKMKTGVMLINTGRGGLVDTTALIRALKKGKVGYAGLDVYEEEENIFFRDLSEEGLQDDQLARLLTFPHVMITAHQAFLTKEALHGIAKTTVANLEAFFENKALVNEVLYSPH